MIDSANDRQVGGQHYRDSSPEFQHWDLMGLNNVGYFPGQITKYVTRWRKKGRLQDLEKAEHYLEKLIELTVNRVMSLPQPREIVLLDKFATSQKLHNIELRIFKKVLGYTNLGELNEALDLIQELRWGFEEVEP